jgi:hypothetical protein
MKSVVKLSKATNTSIVEIGTAEVGFVEVCSALQLHLFGGNLP